MAHDVFISHAHKDKRIADTICERLESARVKCWIAERDISAGEDWTEITRNAIGSSRVLLLVLSENANAAPHIGREIAHAFYTKRIIVPLRLTKTLPRRDFLFYLSNVRWFDAFSPPADQHLEALTETISGLVGGSTATNSATTPQSAKPPQSATKAPASIDFSDSWIGSLQASHYRTLGILKRVALAGFLVGAAWLCWFVFWQPKHRGSLAEDKTYSQRSGPGVLPDSSPHVSSDASASQPAYIYSRFGLWVPADSSPTPAAQQGPQEVSTTKPGEQSTGAIPSPLPGIEKKVAVAAQSPRSYNNARVKSGQPEPKRKLNRREGHRAKARTKSRNGKTHSSEWSPIANIKHWLNTN
jgi:TIR domain